MIKYYQFQSLLLKENWLTQAYVGVDETGLIQHLSTEKPIEQNVENINGAVLQGFQNAHSHAFQYGMAGMAEKHESGTNDDFWSWREAMYQCALRFSPDEMQVVATKLYQHLLRNGYTHVAEFHYVHHDKDGTPYQNLAEMGERLIAAAATAGIKITLIPIFYQQGNFGQPPQPRQRRFISKTPDDYFNLLEKSKFAISHYSNASLAFGVHSLRAVAGDDIIATYINGPKDLPFHLHAAEQLKEVEDCQSFYGKRPIEWLLENLPVNDRFHIVHCTHMTDEEVKQLANSRANAVLCPGTEGNLGDGIFRLSDFAKAGGNWSIGTDSHISLNPLEDLRWLDYTQRLTTHRRNTFNDGAATLVHKTFFAGSNAMGKNPKNYFEVGQPFDAVVYNMDNYLLQQASTENLLPAIVYTADPTAIYGTMVNGKWVYKNEKA